MTLMDTNHSPLCIYVTKTWKEFSKCLVATDMFLCVLHVEENLEKYSGLKHVLHSSHRAARCCLCSDTDGYSVWQESLQVVLQYQAVASRCGLPGWVEQHILNCACTVKLKHKNSIIHPTIPNPLRMSHMLCPWFQHIHVRVSLLF